MVNEFTAIFEKIDGHYIAYVEELPGANTQGETLEEARENLREAIELILEGNRAISEAALKNKNVTREPIRVDTG